MAFPRVNPQETKSWKELTACYQVMKDKRIKDFFQTDPQRFKKYAIRFEDILFDYSKNIIDDNTLKLLLQLANESHVKEAIEAMFTGEKINQTESRAVLHTALRNVSGLLVITDGKDILPKCRKCNQMKAFSGKVHNGEWRVMAGRKLNILSYWRSDLGPVILTEALKLTGKKVSRRILFLM